MDYINKFVVCPACQGQLIVYIDLNDIKKDIGETGGVVKRSLPHQDHLLLLDIDANGDVRAITKVADEVNSSYDNLVSSPFLTGQRMKPRQRGRTIFIVSNDRIFSSILSQQLAHDIDANLSFTLTQTNKQTILQYEDWTIHWVYFDEIDTLPSYSAQYLIIDLLSVFQDKQTEVMQEILAFNPAFYLHKLWIINADEKDPLTVQTLNIIKEHVDAGSISIASYVQQEKIKLFKEIIDL